MQELKQGVRDVAKRGIQGSMILLLIITWLGACALPNDPAVGGPTGDDGPQGLKEAIFDFYIGDLHDPDILAKYSRVDILITDPSRFWGHSAYDGDMALLRAANPDIKIIGFFRSKVVREEWNDESVTNAYLNDLYAASLPYWTYTTTGDTLRDWPGVVLFNPTNPQARKAMRDVFVAYQRTSVNKFDGLFWDYFNNSLWIAPDVVNMTGEPDLDEDGVAHWDDPDELTAYRASEVASIQEMRADLGDGFIQLANGWRALQDSTFARQLDGMFYELFPNIGFYGADKYAQALDLTVSNNVFAASRWPRRNNGGPWLILSNKGVSGRYIDDQGMPQQINLGDINRAIALLADCTSVYYDLSGRHSAGVPSVRLDLGLPLGATSVIGGVYSREFENGRVTVDVGAVGDPFPLTYAIEQDGILVQALDFPSIEP